MYMSSWYNEKRDWIVYLLSKNENRYVGITSRSMQNRLRRHKKSAQNPAIDSLLHNKMRRLGLDGWKMRKLTSLHGDYYEARAIERFYMYLSNLNETLRERPI